MVIENCKKIEPVVVKLHSKTKYTTFFSEHGVYHVLCISLCSMHSSDAAGGEGGGNAGCWTCS